MPAMPRLVASLRAARGPAPDGLHRLVAMCRRYGQYHEVPVLSCLLVSAALSLGQLPFEPPPVAPEPSPAPTAATSDRWLLMKTLQGTWPGGLLDDNRMQLYGWANASFTASSDQHSNLPMGWNHLANNFLLQQNWLRFERTVSTGGTTPTFGFRSDWMLPGSDYRFTLPRGIFFGQMTADHGQPQLYGIDPIQFYAEGYFPSVAHGLDLKLGRIFCQFGVESNAAIDNVLGSRSYTFIYDPFTQTGIMGTLNLTDTWTLQAGMVVGSDDFIDPVDTPTAMGSVKWAPPGGRDSVLFSFIVGSGRFNDTRNFHNPEIFDVVYTHQLSTRLTYRFDGLYGCTYNVPHLGFANWFGAVNYLSCTLTPRLSANSRLEFFDDIQGQRTGSRGLYTALTLGLNFRLRPDLVLRPEVRYDYNDRTRPFEDRHGLFTATTDLILRW
jgi:hypothetical protein